MADGLVQVAPDSTGKKVDASELTVGTNTVERQRIVIADPATATALAPVSATTGLSVNVTNASIAIADGAASLTVDAPVGTPVFVRLSDGAAAIATLPVSLGNSTGKAVVAKTGSLATTSASADQVILTYTVTSGKTFYLEYFEVEARLTSFATTATFFGTASLENPSGTKLITEMCAGAGITQNQPGFVFAEPLPIAAGTVIRVVCTPSSTTGYTWQANFGGYEK
jgi:hypothetical protein